jgi:hypothetical protein
VAPLRQPALQVGDVPDLVLTEVPIELFDRVRRNDVSLERRSELELDVVQGGPVVQFARSKFGAEVEPEPFRISRLATRIRSHPNDSVNKSTTLTFDYQLIANPAYNADRGSVSIFSGRLHAEF